MTFQMINESMVSCSVDSTIRVWNISKNFESFSLEGHEQTVESVVEIENNILFSCSLDKTCKLWDVNTKVCLKKLPKDQGSNPASTANRTSL